MSGDILSLGLTGGGTAGHVWPHFAIIANLDSPLRSLVETGQVKIFYFGGHSGMERQIVAKNRADWTYVPIRTGKLRRYFSLQNFIDPFNILIGFLTAIYQIRRHKIRCVFSKGGFVAAPVVWAAWLNRVPVVIHESDATPALATQLTLPFARRALVTFDETQPWLPQIFKNKVRVSGLPLRSELFSKTRSEALEFFNLDPKRPTLLVFGGSLGAEQLNKRFAQALPHLKDHWNIIHLVGQGKGFAVADANCYRQYEFLSSEMPFVYALADVALCRAGASSIFELAAARIPMILIPLGLHQSRGDQIVNARIFADKGWAVWSEEETLDDQKIVAMVNDIRVRQDEFKARLESAPGAGTAAKVASLLLSFLRREPVNEPFWK